MRLEQNYPAGVTILIASLICFSACNDREPDDLIEENQYIDLLVEFELLNTIQRLEGDSLYTVELTETVLDGYGITMDQFERSYLYYMENPEKHRQMHREAIDRLNQEVGRLRNPEKNQSDTRTDMQTDVEENDQEN